MRCNIEICEGCPYYFYSEVDMCMEGEDDIPDNLEKNCQSEAKENDK